MTPTDEDLQKAREWMDGPLSSSEDEIVRSLAAFRAEARREDLGRLVDESTQNGYEAGRTAEREACERIVGEELGEMVKLGAEEVWPEACLNAILRRLRERAK